MEQFPFTEEEWRQVQDAATAIVDASSMEDLALGASRTEDLNEVLVALAGKYGEHPVLLETEADFAGGVEERIHLYQRAKRLALAQQLPTYSIRTSLARVLISVGRYDEARADLLACESEIRNDADRSELHEWEGLMAQVAASRAGLT